MSFASFSLFSYSFQSFCADGRTRTCFPSVNWCLPEDDYRISFFPLEPLTGIEPVTSSLPRKCSTPELQRLVLKQALFWVWSGRRGSNSRHLAWKANALPTELLPLGSPLRLQPHAAIEGDGGENRIRTCEGVNQQIYSLSSLAA
jgi:hypothetical protein